ncbi:hypothetical protein [Streptomyces sp. NPDC015125]|uniref:hypothetical protein n=1 Tax=Streptomyces sp. NPDC015125 TaxID=3364938 RepID=UPI0036F77074
MITLLARRAAELTRGLPEVKASAQCVLVDGTLAECDPVGDGRGDHSASPAATA